MITVEQFETAVKSMSDYPGLVAMFGGNPCVHPHFPELAEILARHRPKALRGLWTNNVNGHGAICEQFFDPRQCNINVHLDARAAKEIEETWPSAKGHIKGLNHDCSHSPPFVAMQDVIASEGTRWQLISECDINQRWSAMIGVFRGELRGYFCEIAGAQAMLHQHEPDYPDTGVEVTPHWWKQHGANFYKQVDYHCHRCGIPMRGKGTLATNGDKEQVSVTHLNIYVPKTRGREVQTVVHVGQLGGTVPHATDYLPNFKYHDDNTTS